MSRDATTEFHQGLIESQKILLGMACKLTSDRESANELLQETMLKAMENEDKFMAGTNIQGWTCTIMRNIFINQYRRKIQIKTDVDPMDNLYYIDSQVNSGASADSQCLLNELHQVIETLPDYIKPTFALFTRGFAYKEIAEKTETPIGTVKSRIYLARKLLKKQLTK